LKEKGLAIKKPRTKTRLNLNYRANLQNYALRMAGSILEKLRVFSVKIWTKTEIVLNCDGRRVDFGKTEGSICKNDHG